MSSPLVRRKNLKKGLSFSIMVVGKFYLIKGASGLGKTTFINTLCEKPVAEGTVTPPEKAGIAKTLEIKATTVDMEENGVKLQLTVIDTPGFGDNINNQDNFNLVLKYIEEQYDEVLSEENRIKRNPKFQDNRIHALIYFIPPTGHSLKPLDIEFVRKVGPRVNLIPVIAKSDTLTPTELGKFKERIMQDVAHYKLPVYQFPDEEDEDDDEILQENQQLRSLLPFSVVGADSEIPVNGTMVRCRQYPWGIVEVDNSRHCDFQKLRYTLLSSHMQDLKEITHDILYENYRTEKLTRVGDVDPKNLEKVQVLIVPASKE